MPEQVCIVGTGQMAVMCATLLCDNGHDVTMMGREQTITRMSETRESKQMPGVKLPETCKLIDYPISHDFTVFAVPVQALSDAALDFCAMPNGIGVSCSKGIELDTGLRPSQAVAGSVLTLKAVAVLSGPNIAGEVVARKPASAVVACDDLDAAEQVRSLFMTDYFRVYTNTDVVGVELAGALKNVIAIAAGIIDGLGLGNNAKASLVTRGIVEITRLGVSMGASAETFNGLAGLGDLITTCVSPEGRNRTVGERVGRGEKLDDILQSLGSVCEGVPTTRAVRELAAKQGVEMPIVDAVHAVLFEQKPVRAALLELMTREPKAE